MGFVSILGRKGISEEGFSALRMPSSFYDLNLDAVMEDIINKNKEYSFAKYYYLLPRKKEEILYRQQVLKDLENEELVQAIKMFSNDMQRARKYLRNSEESSNQLQKECWCMDSAWFYCYSIEKLRDSLVELKPDSEGFQGLYEWLKAETEKESFKSLKSETRRLMDKFGKLKYTITIQRTKIVIEKKQSEQKWNDHLEDLLHDSVEKEDEFVENPFGSILKLSNLEDVFLERIEQIDKVGFSEFHAYYKEHQIFMSDVLVRFEQEVQFYMSYLVFTETLKKDGFLQCYPQIGENFDVTGCYDMALAKKNAQVGLPVIVNDLTYNEGERFFVITGPNQGGKTTFARAMGHVIYFAMLGLTVPAQEAKIPFFNNILTHFATEESVETGSGKLKEELNRLRPMMKSIHQNNFVLINELFTTATTYDAYIMGNRVMKHFMKEDCIGIYVTHIQELAKEEEGIVSMVAEVDKKDTHIRTYKMTRRAAIETGYASDIVEKYQLTYEEIKRRLDK